MYDYDDSDYDAGMNRQDQDDLDHGLPEHLRDYDAYTWEL